jgi:hypothetical protein
MDFLYSLAMAFLVKFAESAAGKLFEKIFGFRRKGRVKTKRRKSLEN